MPPHVSSYWREVSPASSWGCRPHAPVGIHRFSLAATKVPRSSLGAHPYPPLSPYGSRADDPVAYYAEGILHPAREVRLGFLLSLPEAADIGTMVCDATRDMERHNPQIADEWTKRFEAGLAGYGLLRKNLTDSAITPKALQFDVFRSHDRNDKAVARSLAERLWAAGLKVWFDGWVLKSGESIAAKTEEALEHSRVLAFGMSAKAFGSDWAQLACPAEASERRRKTVAFPFREPLNKDGRLTHLHLAAAAPKRPLPRLLYINWRPAKRERRKRTRDYE
jgi:TIR domain